MRGVGAVRVAACVVVVGTWIGCASPALALEQPVTGECDAVLADAAGELSPAEEADVIEAATTFRTATSFEPRIWVLTQDQDGRDLAEWIDIQTAACDTWHAGNSLLTSNFVVLAVTTDTAELTGETYLWYGDAMPEAMNQRFPAIQADVINPALNDGDIARGLINGLAAVEEVIDSPANVPPVSPDDPTSETPSGSSTGMYVFGGLVIAGAAGYGGYRWNRARQARERARAELAGRFEAAAAGSDQAVLQLDDLAETLDSDIQLVRAGFHPDEAEQQLADVTSLLGTYAAITTQRLDLVVTRDQVLTAADDVTLAQVVTAWEDLRRKSDELLPALTQEREKLAAALGLPESIPVRVQAIPAAVELVRGAERTARDLSFTPSSEVAPLASVPARVAEVQRLAADRRYLAADRELAGVEDDLETARTLLATLPERLEELTTRVDAAAVRRLGLGARIDDARAAEATLAAQFNPAIAAEVDGSATRAADDAARTDAALVEARAGLGVRDLGSVATAVIAAESGLGEAEGAAAAPGALLERVRRLVSEVPTALAGVRSALEALRPRALPGTPAAATLAALQARADAITLAGRPDWPRLEIEVQSLMQAVREINEQIESEERAEAQRQAAAAAAATRKRRRTAGVGSGFLGGWRGSSSGSSSRWSGGGFGGSSGGSGGSRGGGGGSRGSGGRGGGGSRR